MTTEPDTLDEDDPRPRDHAAEQALLGSMLLGERAIDDAVDTLTGPGDYYTEAHKHIHNTILELHGQPGIRADPITVEAHLHKTGLLERCGGRGYLYRLANSVPVSSNADWYAGIVRDTAKLRRIYETATRIAQRARAREDPDDILDTAIADLQAMILDAPAEAPKLSVADRWDDFVDQLEAGEDPNALDTPWKDMNEVTSFKPGDVIAVGAETSGGKSLLGFNCAAHVALRRQRPVLVAAGEPAAPGIRLGADRPRRRTAARRGQLRPGRLARPVPVEDPRPHPVDDLEGHAPGAGRR
jgi:replicative DNA helicase